MNVLETPRLRVTFPAKPRRISFLHYVNSVQSSKIFMFILYMLNVIVMVIKSTAD